MIERIAKLLALAEAAGSSAEAEAAFARAQALASKYSIDLAVAQAQQSKGREREAPVTRTVRIGEKGRHANAPMVLLYDTIARANDVRILIAKDSTTVYPTGFPSDLDVVEALWASLATTMTRFGDELVRDKGAAWRTETVRAWDDRTWSYVDRKVSGQGARKSYYSSFTTRIGERLQEARDAAVRDADVRHFHADAVAGADASNLPSSMALVLRGKAAEVEEAQWANYEAKYGRKRPRGSWKGGRSSTSWSASAGAAGRAAADGVSLNGRRSIAS